MPHGQNITVAVRIRPALRYELNNTEEITITNENQKVVLEKKQSLKFDRVFGPESTQDDLFAELVQPNVEQFLNGYSCSIMAYGQTSSGKSYTMGVPEKNLIKQFSDTTGMIPRAIELLFKMLQSKQNANFIAKVSFIEVYNDNLRDLLVSNSGGQNGAIQVREKLQHGYIQIYTTGNNEVQVKNAKEALSCFISGGLNRTTAQTALNEQSSRSHSIFTIMLEQVLESGEILKSKLNMVDLAGSERVGKAGSQGQQFKEAVGINQGLLCLGNVIKVLSEKHGKKMVHVPYRDSKLTRLLQDSIGGTARCVFVACVSPSRYNYEESQITLKYAARTKNIINKPVRIIERKIKDEDAFNKLQEENVMLKEYLQQMQLKQAEMEQQISMLQSQHGESQVGQSQVNRSLFPTQENTGANNAQVCQAASQNSQQLGQSAAAISGTLHYLLNQQNQDAIKTHIQNINEKAANNQFYNTQLTSDLYNQIFQFQIRQVLNGNISISQLEQYEEQIGDNAINIDNQQIRLFVRLQAFLLQFTQFESSYEKQLILNDMNSNQNVFTRQIANSDYFNDLVVQSIGEIQFMNKLRQDFVADQRLMRLNTQDAGKFVADDVVQSQEFYRNQLLIQERLGRVTAQERELEEANRWRAAHSVMVLDVDDDFQEIQFETDLIDAGDRPGSRRTGVLSQRDSESAVESTPESDGEEYDFNSVNRSSASESNRNYASYVQKRLGAARGMQEPACAALDGTAPGVEVVSRGPEPPAEPSRRLQSLEGRLEDRNASLLQKLTEKQRQLRLDGYGEVNSQRQRYRAPELHMAQSARSEKNIMRGPQTAASAQSPLNLRMTNRSQSGREPQHALPDQNGFVTPKVDGLPQVRPSRPSSTKILQRSAIRK